MIIVPWRKAAKIFKNWKSFQDLATSNTRSIDQIITDKIASADVTSIAEEWKEEEKEDDTTLILSVTNVLDHVNELRR